MKKNYLYNIILTLTNILFPIITFPYVSRIIGPVGVGKIQFIISFSQYFALFAGLGIPLYGIREIAKYKEDKKFLSNAFSELIIIYLIMSLIITVVYLLIVLNLNYFAADKNLYLLAMSLILFGFSSIDWLYSGLEDFKLISIRSVIVKLISVIAVFAFIKTVADYKYFLYISIFAILGNNIINLLLIQKSVDITFHALNFKRHYKPLLYIFSTTIATSMYTVLDTVLLGFLSNAKAVGFYTAAVKLTKISLPFITSVGAVTLPTLSKNFHDKNDSNVQSVLQKSFDFIVFFSVPITVGSFLFAKQFVILFSGMGFINAVLPMQIMSTIPILVGLGFFWGFQILVPAGMDKQLFISVLIGMITGIALNFLLVPSLAETGGALANALTEVIVTFCYYLFVKQKKLFSPKLNTLYQAVISTLSFIAVYLIVGFANLGVLPSLLLAVALCGLSYAFLQSYVFKNHMLVQIVNKLKLKLTNN